MKSKTVKRLIDRAPARDVKARGPAQSGNASSLTNAPVGRKLKRAKAKRPGTRSKYEFILRLFVAGATDRSRQAILRVRELCATGLKDRVKLKVIDIYQQPALARKNQIVATPTLIVELPKPLRRFIGNLANTPDLFLELALIKKGKTVL